MCNVYTFPISLCLSAARSLYHIKIQHNRIGIYLRLALLTIFIHECGTTISNRPLNFIEKHIFSPPSKAPSKSNQFHPPIAIFVVFIYIFSRLLLNGIESKIGLYLKKKKQLRFEKHHMHGAQTHSTSTNCFQPIYIDRNI